MKPGISKAKKAVFVDKAKPWMRPYMPGYVNHPVYSTWAMIRAMECAARKLLQPYLEEGEDAVGCEVKAQHLAPAALGETIRVTAKFKGVKGPVITCRLEAHCGKSKIGEGEHKQFVFSRDRYRKFLKHANNR
ncbi:MAG: thioesterase family protein [Elusimicrobia bacterium]|nr:thioesterase family protein [Elusimicrobiota bacterium]